MANVVVIGGGVGGIASAARLAKLGHRVTLLERTDGLGGRERPVESDGFRWPRQHGGIEVPAVWRDLFRKSGRPLERYVDLDLPSPTTRHVFADGSHLDLPSGSRADQIRAIDDALDPSRRAGLGTAWARYLDQQSKRWDALRAEFYDTPQLAPRSLKRLGRELAGADLAAQLGDSRLVSLLRQSSAADSNDALALAGVRRYAERTFGVWDEHDGPGALVAALSTRLDERGVEIAVNTAACSVVVGRDGRVCGVRGGDGSEHAADHVVAAMDPGVVLNQLVDTQGIGRGGRRWGRQQFAAPARATHLGVAAELANLPRIIVVESRDGQPGFVVDTRGSAPAGGSTLTVFDVVASEVDAVDRLAQIGIAVAGLVAVRLERNPGAIAAETGQAGLFSDRWSDLLLRTPLVEPVAGLHLLGARLMPGATSTEVVWAAANVATRIGPVSRSTGSKADAQIDDD